MIGEDDRIAPAIVEQFKRSGLAHLLAVSGQNVLLLSALALACLIALGVPLRWRLAWLLALIAVYVPVAGGGPSIQRAGIMGAAGVVATLATRPASRWYALGLAAAVTLAINPRVSADPGWQLSFAAVIGIFLLSEPLARLLGGARPGIRGALAQGAALTVAATLATAPMMAAHFGTAALLALPANLLAAPAVAPVMWLGMAIAALGQLGWVPVEPLSALAGILAGFVAQVAAWFAAPGWALAEVELGGPLPLALAYAALAALTALLLRWSARRRALGIAPAGRRVALAAALAGLLLVAGHGGGAPAGSFAGLRVSFLDVGQGDAILLQPPGRAPTLIDAGLDRAGVAERLEQLGVRRLGALIATHPEADHVGGVPAVLAGTPTKRLIFARRDPRTIAAARAAGARPTRVAAGDRWRQGAMRLEVIWPPRERLAAARAAAGRAGDPNALAVVVVIRWHGFGLLLAADAESELAPFASGPVDVLKVAHHGSEDAGLDRLLDAARPRLAVISVGSPNPYGHPAPATLEALAAAGVEVLRTDLEGTVTLEVSGDAWSVR